MQKTLGTIIPEAKASWQKSLVNLITDASQLCQLLGLPNHLVDKAQQVSQLFPLKVTHEFVARMQTGNMYDPLLLQVLPWHEELIAHEDFQMDPLAEQHFSPLPGLIHKYKNRVLVTLTGSCAIHCRYCFRRHFPYNEHQPGNAGIATILDYVAKDTNIKELILSGGDPLNVSDTYLGNIVLKAATIPHLTTIRIHSRLPVVLPNRITHELVEQLLQTRLTIVFVIHTNHAQEIDADVKKAVQILRVKGIQVFNQTVLLKGINDNIKALQQLSEQLFAIGVLPYYLHLLDKVQGTAHFAIPDERAKALHRELQTALPGYLVPKLVREIPFAASKTWLS